MFSEDIAERGVLVQAACYEHGLQGCVHLQGLASLEGRAGRIPVQVAYIAEFEFRVWILQRHSIRPFSLRVHCWKSDCKLHSSLRLGGGGYHSYPARMDTCKTDTRSPVHDLGHVIRKENQIIKEHDEMHAALQTEILLRLSMFV